MQDIAAIPENVPNPHIRQLLSPTAPVTFVYLPAIQEEQPLPGSKYVPGRQAVVGNTVGRAVGGNVGRELGSAEGSGVGRAVGIRVGREVGSGDGGKVGSGELQSLSSSKLPALVPLVVPHGHAVQSSPDPRSSVEYVPSGHSPQSLDADAQ